MSRIAKSQSTRRRRAAVAAALSLTVTLGLGGCGFDVQTLQPYTPSQGVNATVGENEDLMVRNLTVISRAKGTGFLSGTLTSYSEARLTGVSGTALAADGNTAGTLSVALPGPVELAPGNAVVLTDGTEITVTGQGLEAGLTAELTLDFGSVGSTTLQVPVVDGDLPEFSTVSPSPAPSTSGS